MKSQVIRFGQVKVSRNLDGVQFVNSTLSTDEEQFVLLNVIQGNPVGQYARMENDDGKAYFQILQGDTNEASISISLADINQISDALVFHPEVSAYISNISNDISKTFISDMTRSFDYLSDYDDLAGILFTIFTSVKMVILGSEKDNRQFIISCLHLVPPAIAKTQKFHTYSEKLDPKLNWIGMPPVKDSLEQLQGLEFSHTIVSAVKNHVSTPYSCELMTSLAQLIKSNEYENAIDEILHIYELVDQLPETDDATVIADRINSSIADSEFLIKVRDTVHRVSIPSPRTWR